MSSRARPALFAVLALVVLVAVVTLRGYGPLAASEAPDDAPAVATATPSPTPAATSPAAVATTPGTTPAKTPKAKHGARHDDAGASTPTPTPAAAVSPAVAAANPLAVVSEPNRPGFERSTVKLINLNHAPGGPTPTMLKAARAACKELDTQVALLDALHASCAQSIRVAKVAAKMRTSCQTQDAACAAVTRKLASATSRLVTARRDYAHALRADVPAGSCRTQLLPTHDELAGFKALATALDKLATAVAAQDSAAMAKAAGDVDLAGRQSGSDSRPAVTVITAFRGACHLPRYPDPIG